jgi:hypothetical protein
MASPSRRTVVLTIAALSQIPARSVERAIFHNPVEPPRRGRDIPLGLLATGISCVHCALPMVLSGDGAFDCRLGADRTGSCAGSCARRAEKRRRIAGREDPTHFDLLRVDRTSSLDQVEASPGNILVPVRNPHAWRTWLAHCKSPAIRDVVVMTVRLLDVDPAESTALMSPPRDTSGSCSPKSCRWRSAMVDSVRCLIVPGRHVTDAIVATVIPLFAPPTSIVGESASLSSCDQARILGEAWEERRNRRRSTSALSSITDSGRTNSFTLGAHRRRFSPG